MSEDLKCELHPRNRNNGQYNFAELIEAYPPLKGFVAKNKYGNESVCFFDPKAVKALNRAILAKYYDIQFWDIPPQALTPPVPGRADYIHYIADLVGCEGVRCLDVGVGANCIYPIIGHIEYGWEFVGSDIERSSVENAQLIVDSNPSLKGAVELRLQSNPNNIFEGVIRRDERFDVTICNPPFHDSSKSAERGAKRKLRNLKGGKGAELNFGGRANELWCDGGERRFIGQMITESQRFKTNVKWFTSLVSNEDNLGALLRAARNLGVRETKVIDMAQGNKRSRILAWRW